MSGQKPLHIQTNGRLAFFQEFLRHPFQIGSLIPSSRFLERHIVRTAGVSTANTIVELGPGVGGTTRAILRAMPQNSRLLSIEINPHLHSMVSLIEDERFIPHLGDANGLEKIISTYGLSPPDVLISGIPFSTMSHGSGYHIIETIFSVLAPGGRFVAYQLSRRVALLCQPHLGRGKMDIQLFNIPPLRVYRWEKNYL